MQDALEMMWCVAGSYLSSLTPMTMVMSSPLAGAEMMTFLAPPSMCAARLVGVGEEAGRLDDDVDAEVAPRQVRRGRARRATLMSLPSTTMARPLASTDSPSRPRIDVVLEQVGQRRGVGEVVDADDLDVGALSHCGPEEVAADAAESVDAHADGHRDALPSSCTPSTAGRG